MQKTIDKQYIKKEPILKCADNTFIIGSFLFYYSIIFKGYRIIFDSINLVSVLVLDKLNKGET
jgi:hypothetical protein